MADSSRSIYFNPQAANERCQLLEVDGLQAFHQSMPNSAPTPLVSLPTVAAQVGVNSVFVKDESNRFGLPAFKILGASWGVFRAVTTHLKLPSATSLDTLIQHTHVQTHPIVLFTATDGNHGRAVAFMARMLGLPAHIFLPEAVGDLVREKIRSEGAYVHPVSGNYDQAVQMAADTANATEGGLLVQDMAFAGYEAVPTWIVEGYSTMLNEIETQLAELGTKVNLLLTPVGVGSLAQAVVCFGKSYDRNITIVTVEPDTAACLQASLMKGGPVSIDTSSTIMEGMNCGTVSLASWNYLHRLVDVSLTVSCHESHQAVQDLASWSVDSGPCGAASLAALRRLSQSEQGRLLLPKDAVVVLLSTEGSRPYEIPTQSPI